MAVRLAARRAVSVLPPTRPGQSAASAVAVRGDL